jgi:hypothetical protein
VIFDFRSLETVDGGYDANPRYTAILTIISREGTFAKESGGGSQFVAPCRQNSLWQHRQNGVLRTAAIGGSDKTALG